MPFDTTNRFIRVNRDDTRSVGAELSLGWRAVRGHSAHLDLVSQRVRIRDQIAGTAAQRPEHMPAIRANLEGAIRAGRGVTIGATVAHVGAQYCVNPETATDVRLSGQTIVGANALRSWTLGAGGLFRSMRVVLGADNVLDRPVYEQCGLPRAGRTVRIGLDLR
jgi:outer membrane receptor protein involved in Fe transport